MSASLLESTLKTWGTENVESREYRWEILKMVLRFSLHLISSLSSLYASRCVIIKSKFTIARFNLCILLLYVSRILNFKHHVTRIIYYERLSQRLLTWVDFIFIQYSTIYMIKVFIFYVTEMFSYDSPPLSFERTWESWNLLSVVIFIW